ncbi:hypothetical protein [Neobacillus sp. D3-1R]|uniref:hypothetical protein n=1 Tax=Neobacillus sp. D3-1R TaxID=3445778 RepID=UPI003FA08F56
MGNSRIYAEKNNVNSNFKNKKLEHEFSEELSDGGERNEMIKMNQNSKRTKG